MAPERFQVNVGHGEITGARAPAIPLYFDILAAFKARTGLPVLVNTSFNVHEEPIINAPEECAQALAEHRVDYVATGNGVYGPAESL